MLSVHDLHIWEMPPGHPELIGHLEINDLSAWPRIMQSIKDMLLHKHQIDHITLQAEVSCIEGSHIETNAPYSRNATSHERLQFA